MPYLMPTRTESLVYYPQRLDIEHLLEWLEDTNSGRREEDRITFFHVVLTAVARAVMLRPEMNRFLVGRRTYEHNDISVTFIVKTAMDEKAPETEVRLVFTGHETVDEVRDIVNSQVEHKRHTASGADDKLVAFFSRWPRPLLRLVARSVQSLDYHNALPAALHDAIPLYTSIYLVNAGSIGIDPPYHHLFEFGSASVFMSIGRIAKQPVVDERGDVVARSCLNVVYTLDERISEGFYYARALEVFGRLMANPELLDKPGITVDEILAGWPRG
jgi:hypothetical protein